MLEVVVEEEVDWGEWGMELHILEDLIRELQVEQEVLVAEV